MKNYTEIKAAINACRGRQQKIVAGFTVAKQRLNEQIKAASEKATSDLNEEHSKEKDLMSEIKTLLSEDLGQVVNIGVVPPIKRVRNGNTSSKYNRDAIISRIVELRMAGTPFESIANQLNSEGFKPLSASEFRSATVYQLYQNSVKKAGLSSLS
jgi:hypothetical protein